MRTVFILMDSLNRHMLPAYGNDWVKTPNIDRLAKRGIVFDKHYCGSMPCVPARRDIFTGRVTFLETGWGPLEPWDKPLPTLLRKQSGVYSHMITDHCHYFNGGGAGDSYQNCFDSWEYFRGQPWDPWHGVVNPKPMPEDARVYCYGKAYYHQHLANLEYRDAEDENDYSSLQCIDAACHFIERNHGDDNWHLHLELFDPHEPFDCPQSYLAEYDDIWDGPPTTCPNYGPVEPEKDSPDTIEHLRKAYAATLTMNDRRLGRLLDLMDSHGMWKDTAVILTTDHGYLLGEHGLWAKNYPLPYEELVHLPLIVCHPVCEPGRRQALTSIVDIMPTLMDWHGAKEVPEEVTGKSLTPLLQADGLHHDGVLFGYFAREVGMTDGTHSYYRMPLPASTCDLHFTNYTQIPRAHADQAIPGVHLKTAKGIPHFKIERQSARPRDSIDESVVFDLKADPSQDMPIKNAALEAQLARKLTELMQRAQAPVKQYERLGLCDLKDHDK